MKRFYFEILAGSLLVGCSVKLPFDIPQASQPDLKAHAEPSEATPTKSETPSESGEKSAPTLTETIQAVVVPSETSKTPPPKPSTASPVPFDQLPYKEPNELSWDLSGMSSLDDYSHLAHATRRHFKKHAKRGWRELEKHVLQPLRAWREVLAPLDTIPRVFYPFGGPDATYVTQLFPNASEYILVGLEATGSLMSARRIFEEDDRLDCFDESFETFFKKGYFVTHDMAVQLSSKKGFGVAPLILAQLVRLGYTVTEFLPLKDCDESFGDLRTLPGFCVSFADPAGQSKRLIYCRCQLSNNYRDQTQQLFSFVQKSPFLTLLKSSSYALHNEKGFSDLRNFIQNSSKAILQDDTGVPYKYFDSKFKKTLYGFYNGPTLPVFKPFLQDDLKEAYRAANPDQLPFRLGYGCLLFPSNLQLAVRKTEAVQTPAPSEPQSTPSQTR